MNDQSPFPTPLGDGPAPGAADRLASADDHARSWALIPWLVNGRAAGDERRRALAHLQHCAACRAEWQAQQALAEAVRATEPEVSGLPAAEAGLARLMGRLDPVPQPRPARRPVGRLPLALAAAVAVQSVGLVLLSLHLARQEPADYAALSQPAGAAAAAATLRIVPDGSMPLAQWHALLQTQGLVVVEGPNSAGAYGVAARRAGAASAAGDDALLARLRATPGILLAEPLGRP